MKSSKARPVRSRNADIAQSREEWTDSEIADAFSCTINTVENVHRRFSEADFKSALCGKQRADPPRERRFEGDSPVIAPRLSDPPTGYAKSIGRSK